MNTKYHVIKTSNSEEVYIVYDSDNHRKIASCPLRADAQLITRALAAYTDQPG